MAVQEMINLIILATLAMLSTSLAIGIPVSTHHQNRIDRQNSQPTTYLVRPHQTQQVVPNSGNAIIETTTPLKKSQPLEPLLSSIRSNIKASTPQPTPPNPRHHAHFNYHASGAGRRRARQILGKDYQKPETRSSSTLGAVVSSASGGSTPSRTFLSSPSFEVRKRKGNKSEDRFKSKSVVRRREL